MPSATVWNDLIKKEKNPNIKNKRDLIQYIYSKTLSMQKTADYFGISITGLYKILKKIKETQDIDINYFFCEYCNQKVYRIKGQGRKTTCDNKECKEKLQKKQLIDAKRRSRSQKSEIKELKKQGVKKNACLRCGLDKGKNKWWCSQCHSVISFDIIDEHQCYGGLSY